MRKIMTYLFLFVAIWIYDNSLSAENDKVDSLLIVLKTSKEDTNKVKTIHLLCREFMFNNPDSAIVYGNQGLLISKKLNWEKGIANSLSNLGAYNYLKGDYNKALENFLRALEIDRKMAKSNIIDEVKVGKQGISKRLGNIGLVYTVLGNPSKALDYYFEGLKLNEEVGDTLATANILGNIGILYTDKGDYSLAMEYYLKALKLKEELKDKITIAQTLSNIGILYRKKLDYPKALEAYLKALKLDSDAGNKRGISDRLGNIGSLYSAQKDYVKATEYYLKALEISQELGYKNGEAVWLSNIGTIYCEQKKYFESENCFLKSIAIAEAIGDLYQLSITEEEMSNLYLKINRHQLAFEHYKKAMVLKDTLFNQEKNKEITRKEMYYEFEKKEAVADAIHNKELENQQKIADEKSRKQNITILSVFIGLIFVVVFAGFIFRSLRVTRKQKQLIEVQKAEVEHQKQLVEEHQKEIIDSITYARRIQNSLLPSEKYIDKSIKRLKVK